MVDGPQVGQGAVAIVPVFTGFRSAVSKEVADTGKSATAGFRAAWKGEGEKSGKGLGVGFKKAYDGATVGFTSKATKELEVAVTKSARTLSQARLKEQDAAGKLRLAETQLAEARKKYAHDSSQVVRAEERLATASRQLGDAHDSTERATKDLTAAQRRLADAADQAGDEVAAAGRRGSSGFQSSLVGGVKTAGIAMLAGFAALNIGGAIGDMLSDGIREAWDLATSSIGAASNLQESVNAVEVSYGAAAESVLALGDDSVRSFGLSNQGLNGFAVQFSAFAKTVRSESPASFIEELIGRGTDFASVYNLEVAEALQLFQSGLAGETEPLRRYGLDLSAAAVESYALANGIGTASGELTEAEKVQARYGLLLASTNQVQGDWINTSDSLANTNRRNSASWEDVQAKLGEGFLPVAQELATILADDVLPLIAELAREHGPELAAAFEEALPTFKELAEDVLPLLPDVLEAVADVLPDVLNILKDTAPSVIDIAEATGGWVSGLTALFDLLEGDISLLEFTERVVDLEGPFGDAARRGEDLRQSVIDVGSGFNTAAENISRGFERLPGEVRAGFEDMGLAAEWFSDVLSGDLTVDEFRERLLTLPGPLGDVATMAAGVGLSMQTAAENIGIGIEEAIAWITGLPERAQEALGDVSRTLEQSGRDLIEGFLGGIRSSWDKGGEAVSDFLDWIGGFFPNSPAKRGPLSGSGWTALKSSGAAVLEQFESGMSYTGSGPRLSNITSALLPAYAPSTTATASTAPAGTTVVLEGDSAAFMQWMNLYEMQSDGTKKLIYRNGKKVG